MANNLTGQAISLMYGYIELLSLEGDARLVCDDISEDHHNTAKLGLKEFLQLSQTQVREFFEGARTLLKKASEASSKKILEHDPVPELPPWKRWKQDLNTVLAFGAVPILDTTPAISRL